MDSYGTVDQGRISKQRASRLKKDLIGRWRLTGMSNWDTDFMDAELPACIEFKAGGRGAFHFGYVQCQIDWQPEQRKLQPGVAFTFEGNDEMDPVQGRGWAAVRADGTLEGHFYFHLGDDSYFVGERDDRQRS